MIVQHAVGVAEPAVTIHDLSEDGQTHLTVRLIARNCPTGIAATGHMIDHLRKLQTQGGRDMAARLVVEHDLLFKTWPHYSFSSISLFLIRSMVIHGIGFGTKVFVNSCAERSPAF